MSLLDHPAHKGRIGHFLLKDASRILLLLVVVALLVWAVHQPLFRRHFLDVAHIRREIQSATSPEGAVGIRAAFVLVAALFVGLGIPRLYISVVAGVAFGAIEGIAISLVASLIGASITYEAGRSLLSGMVRRRFKGRIRTWKRRFQKNAFWWVLNARLVPFANSTVMSLVCGACRAPYRQFLAATAIGFVPLTIVFVLLGSGGAKRNVEEIALAVILLLLTNVIRRTLQGRRPLPPEQDPVDVQTVP